MEHPPLLNVQNLQVEYVTDMTTIHAVNGLSFSLEKRETVGLVGETGAGKTTTALAIMNLLATPPARVVGGEIQLEGSSTFSLGKDEMRKIRGGKISMIFQDPMTALNPVIPVGKQIMEVIRLHETLSRKDAMLRAVDMLTMVGIPGERYEDYPHQFSGGMKQRVVIAMALACNPRLLIADEPTTALDVTIQAQMLDLINDLKQKFDTAMLLITHDLGVVAEVCDKVMIMYAGEILERGTLDDVYNHTGHPYTMGLFESIPRLDENIERLKAIEGLMPDPADLPKGCKFCPRCPVRKEHCETQQADLREISPGHWVRCW
jgi:peptide/nickel transport system ATP-binding protein